MKDPLVSVVMSVYNDEVYLSDSIDSVLNQTFPNFEFLIINDGSTDLTELIIQSYDDPRIKLINNAKNLGLTKSLNIGLGLAKGKYVARMDGDDLSYKERFQLQFNFLEKNTDIDVCGTWFESFGIKSGVVKYPQYNNQIKATLFFCDCICHPSVFIRKESLDKYQIKYNEEFTFAQDYELWCRESKRLSFANIPQVLLKYRTHSKQVSTDKVSEQENFADKIYYMNFDKTGTVFSRLEKKRFSRYITRDERVNEISEFVEVIFLLQKLRNLKEKPSNKFDDVLSDFWLSTILCNTHLGFEGVKAVFKNRPPCKKIRCFLRVMKFILKSFYYQIIIGRKV